MALPKIREQIEARVKDTGDTMTGLLTLSGNPMADFHAATKKYVDDNTPDVANAALKLTTNAGSSTLPVYFADGIPKQCNTSLGISITGNAATATFATKATQDGNGANIASTYLKLSGGTMTGNVYFPNNKGIIQNQGATSNYTNIVTWLQGGVSENTYDPQIGHHNTGDTNGAIILLPYSTANSPWNGADGLYIGSKNLYYNGSSVLNTSNYNSYVPTKTGGGASGTWGISISGNAATATTATKATQDGNGATIASTYLKLTGGTVTGATTFNSDVYISKNVHFRSAETVTSGTTAGIRNSICIYGKTYGNDATQIKTAGKLSYGDPGPQIIFGTNDTITSAQKCALIFTDNDTIATGCSLSLVATEAACAFIVPSDTAYTTYKARNIAANTSALTSGSSSLASGNIYVQYE